VVQKNNLAFGQSHGSDGCRALIVVWSVIFVVLHAKRFQFVGKRRSVAVRFAIGSLHITRLQLLKCRLDSLNVLLTKKPSTGNLPIRPWHDSSLDEVLESPAWQAKALGHFPSCGKAIRHIEAPLRDVFVGHQTWENRNSV
jgi:hypothetical protein